MTLYHFCAAHMKDDIMRCGLTLGQFPFLSGGEYQLITRCQWLTAEPDSREQSWATQNMIDYSRTAYRLTINIPDNYHKKIVLATDFVKDMSEESAQIVTGWPGSDKWYIYRGIIPANWIVGCKKTEVGHD